MRKITLITITYNAEMVLKSTLDSVFCQDYNAIEHIIVDGASTDNTVAIAKDYMERSFASDGGHEVRMLVEPDNGIYDAMNKGLQMATGEYVCFLNAGDSLHSANTISKIVACIDAYCKANGTEKTAAKCGDTEGAAAACSAPAVVYGDTDIVDGDRVFLRHRRLSPPEELSWQSFRQGMLVCHQAFYARADIAKATPYNMTYRYSADFDWCIRIMKRATEEGLSMVNVHDVVADYLEEGTTTRHRKASLRERFRIMAHHYGMASTCLNHVWFVVRALIKR